MKDFYIESSKLHFNNMIDADICKLKALKQLVIENRSFDGRMETDYIDGLDRCIKLLDFMRLAEYFLIQEDEPEHFRPIKNTSRNFCYQILFNLQ